MSAICVRWSEKLGLASFLAMGVAVACLADSASAQITPDNTMGGENSTVTSSGTVDAINGGATRGTNLFHSFQEFNVNEGRAAVFTNPAGIENILTRVTGAKPSNIFGTLGVAGNANLFLINPNGIIFGANARLDVGGSFVATTANAISFGDRGVFSATNPSNPGLLSVNPNALLFNQIRAAAIQNNSVADSGLNPSSKFTAEGLRVPDGKSLLLVGGEINMNGGGLSAFGGRVELGGLASAGTVGMNENGNNLSLSFLDGAERSNVFLNNGAQVNVTAAGGGSIAVHARNFEMTHNSGMFAGIATGLGEERTQAGNVEINATGAINLNNGSRITNYVELEARGRGGDVSVTAGSLQLDGGARISAAAFGAGKGGSLTVNASDVQLSGTSADSQIESTLISTADQNSTGDAGDLTINTHTLLVRDGAQIGTGTFSAGKGGSLTVNASDVQLSGESADGQTGSGLFANVDQNSTGDAGDLTINTHTLLVRDGAQVFNGTFSAGKGGSLTVNASDVQLSGEGAISQYPSGLFADAEQNSTGDAGDLTINTDTLLVRDGAQVGASTFEFSAGKGGNLTVNASEVQLIGESADGQYPSGLVVNAQRNSTGDAGDLTINTDTLLVQDGAGVSVSSRGTGTAGNMRINARSIRLNNNALLIADTRSAFVDPNSEQATININSQNLFVNRNSNIFTNAEGENVIGGNINIDTDFLIAVENSDISANSANFRGGNVRIDAFGIFGTQFREVPDDRTSDITASGASPQLGGTVELNIPNIEPNNGLVNLPSIPVDTQVTQACTPSSGQNQSEFVVTGRGGLPPNPTEVLSSDAISIDWVALQPTLENQSSPTPATSSTAPSPAPMVEAQGWEIDRQGKVILTASNVPAQAHNSWQSSARCNPL
ncbi:S-layer family protein [Chroococcidiopsis sp. CCMEE 29]|uniref:two-partner secretion domain-containing protein n=1 Tax=Chroococcidiopsis sp. CCMEE 29 TaxID=155894 RepID=UPI0020210957|nr:S-layer family protein [Chroococcidiopsis sp. CCMEE 29]